jgi:putative membrane protein
MIKPLQPRKLPMFELNALLVWLHLLGLVFGGATLVAMLTMGRLMPASTQEQRLAYFRLGNILIKSGRAGLVVLLVTGPLLIWLKYGSPSGFGPWFSAKMALVLVVLGANVISGISYKRVQRGDASAARVGTRAGMVGAIALLLVVLCAVFAFEL